ncbi:MAG TPA: hypothetical protein VHO07_05930 [Streptosporangiaceae bacterium]|nr:hypothetical protein [Streptosporangiaceae bacterium]
MTARRARRGPDGPAAHGIDRMVRNVAGFFSRRLAKTALPVASAAIVVNGLQGTYLHARGIAQKPGGWKNARVGKLEPFEVPDARPSQDPVREGA